MKNKSERPADVGRGLYKETEDISWLRCKNSVDVSVFARVRTSLDLLADLEPFPFWGEKRTDKAEPSLLVRGQQALDFCSVAVLSSSIKENWNSPVGRPVGKLGSLSF